MTFDDDFPLTARRYLDETRFVVRMTAMPGTPDEVSAGAYCVFGDGLRVTLDEAAQYAAAVAWDPDAKLFHPFSANQRYNQYEWGASGYTLEFAVDVLESVGVETVMIGLGYAVAKIRGKHRRPDEDLTANLERARNLSIEATAAIFAVARADLHVTNATIKDDVVELKLKGSGAKFTATVTQTPTGEFVAQVRRKH